MPFEAQNPVLQFQARAIASREPGGFASPQPLKVIQVSGSGSYSVRGVGSARLATSVFKSVGRLCLSSGTAIKLSLPYARAINPITKTNWEGVGVEPDIKTSSEKSLDTAVANARKKIAARLEEADGE